MRLAKCHFREHLCFSNILLTMRNFLNSFFEIEKRNTSIKTELLAGLTTFLAMAYIAIVNPSILSDAGMDFGGVFVATCLAAALGSLIMGLTANYPIALAPGMGQNAFFAYTIVIGMGHSWQTALGTVFLSGCLFILISLTPIRGWIINSIPRNLKHAISAGIGLFLAFIALQNASIVEANLSTLVTIGELSNPTPVLALFGLFLIVALDSKKIPGSILLGLLIVSLFGWVSGIESFYGVASTPPPVDQVFLKLDIASAFDVSMVSVIFTLLLVDVFDAAGTIVGITNRTKLIGKNGKIPRLKWALLADSSATTFGALFGTSPTTSYIESAAGVESGGRTGLSAVTVSLLFVLCLGFAPLVKSIPSYATSAALLFVAALMVKSIKEIDWDDSTEFVPAIITAIAMPFTFSISDGIGIGFISFVSIKVLSGNRTDISYSVYFVALLFTAKFIFL